MAGIHDSYRREAVEARASLGTKSALDYRTNRWVSNGWVGKERASGGGLKKNDTRPANPNAGSISLGRDWRLFVGRQVVTTKGDAVTKSRTFGVGRLATLTLDRGNVVFGKGLTLSSWSSKAPGEKHRGRTTTVGWKTHAHESERTPSGAAK